MKSRIFPGMGFIWRREGEQYAYLVISIVDCDDGVNVSISTLRTKRYPENNDVEVKLFNHKFNRLCNVAEVFPGIYWMSLHE